MKGDFTLICKILTFSHSPPKIHIKLEHIMAFETPLGKSNLGQKAAHYMPSSIWNKQFKRIIAGLKPSTFLIKDSFATVFPVIFLMKFFKTAAKQPRSGYLPSKQFLCWKYFQLSYKYYALKWFHMKSVLNLDKVTWKEIQQEKIGHCFASFTIYHYVFVIFIETHLRQNTTTPISK